MEKNYKFVIAYDGTRFFGWEHQPDKETIRELCEAFSKNAPPFLL